MKLPPPTKTPSYSAAFDFVPENGQAVPLGGDIYWLRMPLPFELNHINLWLMESAGGWTIVDTGFNFAETLQHWDALFAGLLAKKPVERLFVTHFHPDHFGLAAMLEKRTGVPVQMTEKEFAMACTLTGEMNIDTLERQYTSYYTEAGLADDLRIEMIARRFGYRKMVPAIPAAISAAKPGTAVALGGNMWKIIGGYGHSPEHACLYSAEQKLFISGDIVLPSISPNISLYPGGSGDPVGAYLESLDRIEAEVPDDVTVLPSHGVPFKGLHRRLDELRQHHARRFQRLREVLADRPRTAFDAMTGLFAHRALAGSDVFFALGETLSHLAHEEQRGKVTKTMRDGIALYACAE